MYGRLRSERGRTEDHAQVGRRGRLRVGEREQAHVDVQRRVGSNADDVSFHVSLAVGTTSVVQVASGCEGAHDGPSAWFRSLRHAARKLGLQKSRKLGQVEGLRHKSDRATVGAA